MKIGYFCGQKSFCDFFFIEIKFRWNKHIQFSKICEKNFLSEKNPTSSFKIGGIWWSKKVLWFFYFFFRKKLQVNFFLPIFENLRKTFSFGKKSDFKFQNREYFVKKMFPKFVESSVIISLNIDISPYFAKIRRVIFI